MTRTFSKLAREFLHKASSGLSLSMGKLSASHLCALANAVALSDWHLKILRQRDQSRVAWFGNFRQVFGDCLSYVSSTAEQFGMNRAFCYGVILLLSAACTGSKIQINKRTSGNEHSDDASPPEEVLGASIEIICGLEKLGIGCLMQRDGFHLDMSILSKKPDFEIYTLTSSTSSQLRVSDLDSNAKKLTFQSAPSTNKWGTIIQPQTINDGLALHQFLSSNLSNPQMGIGIAFKSSLAGERRIAIISQCAMVSYLFEWGTNNSTKPPEKQVTAIPTDLVTALSADGLVRESLNISKATCEDSGALKIDKLAFQTEMKLAFYQWAIASGIDLDAAFIKLTGK